MRKKPQVDTGEGEPQPTFETGAGNKIVCQGEFVVNEKCTGITQV